MGIPTLISSTGFVKVQSSTFEAVPFSLIFLPFNIFLAASFIAKCSFRPKYVERRERNIMFKLLGACRKLSRPESWNHEGGYFVCMCVGFERKMDPPTSIDGCNFICRQWWGFLEARGCRCLCPLPPTLRCHGGRFVIKVFRRLPAKVPILPSEHRRGMCNFLRESPSATLQVPQNFGWSCIANFAGSRFVWISME